MGITRARSALLLGAIKSLEGVHGYDLATSTEEQNTLGSRACPLDISVLWTADVESPVFSTPVIVRSAPDGRRQIVAATLRQAVELLEGDGSIPSSWPIEIEDRIFFASPAVHDVDGDGVQDFCVASIDGEVQWMTTGERGPYLPSYKVVVNRRRARKDWWKELAGVGAESLSPATEQDTAKDHSNDGAGGRNDSGRRSLSSIKAGDTDGARTATGATAGTEDTLQVEDVNVAEFHELYEGYEHDLYGSKDISLDDLGNTYWEGYGGDDFAWYGDRYGANGAPGGDGIDDNSAHIQPHILAAPVFADVDDDGTKEMIIPVSYLAKETLVSTNDADGRPGVWTYVAGSLHCWDFERSRWTWTHDLGERAVHSSELVDREFVTASPTVADLDGDGKTEIIVGTEAGDLHVLDSASGVAREGFPVSYAAIKGQIAVADVDGDGDLEMLFGDASGAAVCLKHYGEECWKRDLTGSMGSTFTLGDVDGDGSLDVVFGVNTQEGTGEVWALSAEEGLTLPHFPVHLGNRRGISSAITIVDLHEHTAAAAEQAADDAGERDGASQKAGGTMPLGGLGPGLHLLAPSEDGHIYVIEGATGCINKIDLGERMLGMVLADDLDGDSSLDLLVGTMSGQLVALSANVPFHPLNAWSSPVRHHLNGFVHGRHQGVFFQGTPSTYDHVVTRQVLMPFEVVDNAALPPGELKDDAKSYQVVISTGAHELHRHWYNRSGTQDAEIVLHNPQALLLIEMITGQGLVFQDSVRVGYNTGLHTVFKWVLVLPVALAASPFWWRTRGGQSSSTQLPG